VVIFLLLLRGTAPTIGVVRGLKLENTGAELPRVRQRRSRARRLEREHRGAREAARDQIHQRRVRPQLRCEGRLPPQCSKERDGRRYGAPEQRETRGVRPAWKAKEPVRRPGNVAVAMCLSLRTHMHVVRQSYDHDGD
jgi:hypothetical protein